MSGTPKELRVFWVDLQCVSDDIKMSYLIFYFGVSHCHCFIHVGPATSFCKNTDSKTLRICVAGPPVPLVVQVQSFFRGRPS